MSAIELLKDLGIRENVIVRVIDEYSGRCVQQVTGHNAVTQTMLRGIGHYLIGDGVLNQGTKFLGEYIPKFISLGTMGLPSQDEDPNGLPQYIGLGPYEDPTYEKQFDHYLNHCPGFGADGSSISGNNQRDQMGLGKSYQRWMDENSDYQSKVFQGELISNSFKRVPIAFRRVLTSSESEIPNTIDVVFSAMISSGALKYMRGYRNTGTEADPVWEQNPYLFISEVGLWNTDTYNANGNGMLAGFRIIPSEDSEKEYSPENYTKLKSKILRVEKSQVVQVVWKFQLGSVSDLDVEIGSGSQAQVNWRRV